MRKLLLLALGLPLAGQDLERLATESIRKNCLQCHSAAAKMGGLVLESRAAALRVLSPGAAKNSVLVDRVKKGEMPVGNPLPAAERELLARWVDAGAPWSAKLTAVERKRAGKDWWSLQPVVVKPPAHAEGTMIDRYLLDAMAAKQLKPSPPADKRTLIRRATFDLLGLPPTPAEIEEFVKDTRADAYERLVDRLLASPAYGERWGRHWMDVIRFGESHGYEQNHLRPNAWQFRDYVIRSFNEDKPFDRMVMEHIAGDVVGAGDPAVEVGTGFLVAGPHDTVGNQNEAAKRQQRADDLDDYVNATGSAFLGLTVNCAKCHDHKFDPILQADYYRMASIFAGVIHAERDLATAAEKESFRQRMEPLQAQLKQVSEAMKTLRQQAEPQIAARRESILAKYRPAVDARLTEENFAPTPARFIKLRIEAMSTGGVAALDEIEVWAGARNVALASSGSRIKASSVRKADDDANAYSEQHLIDGKFAQRWFAESNKPVDLVLELPRTETIQKISFSRDRMGGFMGRFEGPIPSQYQIEVSSDGEQWRRVASSEGRLPPVEAQREELLLLAVLSERDQAQWRQLQHRQKALQQQTAAVPKLAAAYAGRFEQPKEPVYLLKRGNVMDRGDVIQPASLSTLAMKGFTVEENAPEKDRRVALAKWIADAQNPLTPRVLVNRLWHYHFGRGIVGTPSDFGYNGERPSHPELLDYLAARLTSNGWRLKPLHKEIMLSLAYRQSSAMHEANARIDSEARYLWRFPPQRLQAEAIRDTVLSVSGKLDRKMGGPGFRLYRYTVDNVATYYPLEKFGEDTFRRAVYQTAARSVKSEMLGQYDCPDSSLPEPRRYVTTSPLQALASMNNVFMMDQARFFAARLEKEAGASTAAQVKLAFQLAFGREADSEELAASQRLITQHGLAAFCRAVLNANEFLYVM